MKLLSLFFPHHGLKNYPSRSFLRPLRSSGPLLIRGILGLAPKLLKSRLFQSVAKKAVADFFFLRQQIFDADKIEYSFGLFKGLIIRKAHFLHAVYVHDRVCKKRCLGQSTFGGRYVCNFFLFSFLPSFFPSFFLSPCHLRLL